VFTKMIEKNTTVPANAEQTFSTAEDNQSAVTVHVLQGERQQCAGYNKSLGPLRPRRHIPPSPRGMPQIEVAFDIDANGIVNVTAKDKKQPARSQKVEIKAGSGLSEDEIAKMVADAEANREEDKKFRELVETRNRADGMVHAVEKSLTDLGEKVSGEERAKVESALSDLKGVLKGDDKDKIEKKLEALMTASASIAQQAYAQSNPQGAGPDATGGAAGGQAGGSGGRADDNVVDAEFEEVKDKDRRAS
jgi:molecular chaperone DnaK